MRNLYEELFGFRRDFDEMFNRILTGKPSTEWAEFPAFKKEFNFTPAVSRGKHTSCSLCPRKLPLQG